MAKSKKRKKPQVVLHCGRCNMKTPHLLLKHLSTEYIKNGRVIQCKQCNEKTVVDKGIYKV